MTFQREVTQEHLRDLYRGATALVYPGEEDFGIVMAEAQACGTPVIALGAGGALDIVDDGRTGLLVDDLRAAPLAAAVRRMAVSDEFEPAAVRGGAERFSAAAFRAGIRSAADDLIATHRPHGDPPP